MTVQAQVQPSQTAKDSSVSKRADATPVVPSLPDSIYTVPGGLRIGLDISRFALLFFQPYRTDVTAVADIRLSKNLYAAIETGYNRTSHSDSNYTYKGNGVFATIGVDYNFLKKVGPQDKHMVYGGIRYGFSHNSYEVPSYNIHNDYWDNDTQGSYPKTNITAHWVELVFGMRVEALKNLFLGWSVRERIMVSNSASAEFPPLVIAGYGSGSKKSIFDVQYTVSYNIPLYRIKVRVPREQPKKKK